MRNAVEIGGALMGCDAPVMGMRESGLAFSVQRMRETTRFVICHWTGSENKAPSVYRNMIARGVSVHFIVAQDGLVFQCADANARLAHTLSDDYDERGQPIGDGNSYGIGIEFVNRGHDLKLPDHGHKRTPTEDIIHSRRVRYGKMTRPQVASAIALCTTLCRAYRLPMIVPIDARTGHVYAGKSPRAARSRFSGICGHYWFNAQKVDPGLDLLEQIAAALDPHPPALPVA